MNLRSIVSRRTVNNISKLNSRHFSRYSSGYRNVAATCTITLPSFHLLGAYHGLSFINPKFDKPFGRFFHTSEEVNSDNSSSEVESESQDDAAMNEFLSRFVWLMRKKLSEVYPDCDKHTINGMLMVIVENVVTEIERGGLQNVTASDSSTTPSQEFSEDLWRTVWDVSNAVLQDMEKEKKKEKMKSFLYSEEVKVMYRFAGQVGIRGDMLRELRFKWAREKMEKNDFYENLERMQKVVAERKSAEEFVSGEEKVGDNDNNMAEDKQKTFSLPKRHGKIKYKIYGLDLSDSKWAAVADKINEAGKVLWHQEPKPLSGKCKIVTDKILSLHKEDDPAPLLGEWKDLLQPSRIDWIDFLDKLKGQNPHLYLKVAEFVLSEESFQPNIRDYSNLIEVLAEDNRFEDVERVLHRMNENGIVPDVITSVSLIQIYCKSGNLDQAKEVFQSLRALGYQPDVKVYEYMILAYVKAGNPRAVESLLREMDIRELKPSKEIYMALLQSFFKAGDSEAAGRIFNRMQCFSSDFSPDFESLSLMVELCARTGDHEHARNYFNQMMKSGKPDDKTTACMIAAYEKKNLLDVALDLLLQLEKNGFEPGVRTYTVLVDWLIKMELFDETEQVVDKIAELGEAPPFKLQISLCVMYFKSGAEKKARQALGALESKIDLLEPEDFERIISALAKGGFEQDALRIRRLMEARGFVLSYETELILMTNRAVGKSKKLSLARGN